MRITKRRTFAVGTAAISIAVAGIAGPPAAHGDGSTSIGSPQYRGFVVEGGPAFDGALSDSPANWIAAAEASAKAGGTPEVFDPATNSYSQDSAGLGATPDVSTDAITPDSVTSGYTLPSGTRATNYVWRQNTATELGVIRTSDGAIVAEVNIKITESITGNTSDGWKYTFSLDYVKGGLWRLTVPYRCAVNETGKPDDYCENITYPDGSKDANLTRPFTTEVHDLATGSTVQQNISAYFGSHATPPPSGSSQVKKYAQLTEQAYFQEYGETDTAYIRTFDVCVPNKATFSGVTLCGNSGTGN